jgi:hypothetical protein
MVPSHIFCCIVVIFLPRNNWFRSVLLLSEQLFIFLFIEPLKTIFLLLQAAAAAAAIKKTQEILAVKETLKKKQEEKRKVCNESDTHTFRMTCWNVNVQKLPFSSITLLSCNMLYACYCVCYMFIKYI